MDDYSPLSPSSLSQFSPLGYEFDDVAAPSTVVFSQTRRLSKWEEAVITAFPGAYGHNEGQPPLLNMIVLADHSEVLVFALKAGLVICKKNAVRNVYDEMDNITMPLPLFAVHHNAKRCLSVILGDCTVGAISRSRHPRSNEGVAFYAMAMSASLEVFEVLTGYDRAYEESQLFYEIDNNEDTVLHALVKKRAPTAIVRLVASAYPKLIMRFNKHYLSPLHLAAHDTVSSEVLKTFIDLGRNVVGVNFSHDKVQLTPLHHAARSDSVVCALELIERGAVQSPSGRDGFYPAHVAAFNGNLNVLRVLVESNKDVVDCTNFCGETPAMLAAKSGRTDALSFLVNSWGHVENNRSVEGWSILHYAVVSNKPDTVTYVSKQCPDLAHAMDLGGSNPLYLSIVGDHSLSFNSLMESSDVAKKQYQMNEFSLVLRALKCRAFKVLAIIYRREFTRFTKKFANGNTLLHIYLQEPEACLETVMKLVSTDESLVAIRNNDCVLPVQFCEDQRIVEYLNNALSVYMSPQHTSQSSCDEDEGCCDGDEQSDTEICEFPDGSDSCEELGE